MTEVLLFIWFHLGHGDKARNRFERDAAAQASQLNAIIDVSSPYEEVTKLSLSIQGLRAELEAARTTIKNHTVTIKQQEADHRRALTHMQLEYETKFQVSKVAMPRHSHIRRD
jgi:tryptophan 2,3-dioxygenase